MSQSKTIKSALISVFSKEGLAPIVEKLNAQGVTIYSTGGTQKFINDLGIKVVPAEDITDYPSILGGRVKTLHPKIFGGILNRQDNTQDVAEMTSFSIPQIDAVIVDLYPFEKTVASDASNDAIIEKIDIGGISLIRAAAKNYKDVICVSSVDDYAEFLSLISEDKGSISIEDRKRFATKSFNVSSHYDSAIFNYFNSEKEEVVLKLSETQGKVLRYGENPHQKGYFFGDLEAMFEKIHGKELSYNNLLDVDAAVNLMNEFHDDAPTFAILKHNNACGVAQRETLHEAYVDALAGDPVSAFGGVLISNSEIDLATAEEIHSLFCEVVIAPSFSAEAEALLKGKKNRILLIQNSVTLPETSVRSCLNGVLVQEKNMITDERKILENATTATPIESEIDDLKTAMAKFKYLKVLTEYVVSCLYTYQEPIRTDYSLTLLDKPFDNENWYDSKGYENIKIVGDLGIVGTKKKSDKFGE